MSLIFEFKELRKAKAFVATVKKRFDLDGDAEDEFYGCIIDRVDDPKNDAEVEL